MWVCSSSDRYLGSSSENHTVTAAWFCSTDYFAHSAAERNIEASPNELHTIGELTWYFIVIMRNFGVYIALCVGG